MLTPINAHLINSHLGLITSTSIPEEEEEEEEDDKKKKMILAIWFGTFTMLFSPVGVLFVMKTLEMNGAKTYKHTILR